MKRELETNQRIESQKNKRSATVKRRKHTFVKKQNKKSEGNEVEYPVEAFKRLAALPGRVPDIAYPEDDDL